MCIVILGLVYFIHLERPLRIQILKDCYSLLTQVCDIILLGGDEGGLEERGRRGGGG